MHVRRGFVKVYRGMDNIFSAVTVSKPLPAIPKELRLLIVRQSIKKAFVRSHHKITHDNGVFPYGPITSAPIGYNLVNPLVIADIVLILQVVIISGTAVVDIRVAPAFSLSLVV